MWKILGSMEWSLQRPARQARELDPQKVQLWKTQRWPVKKNARRRKAWIFFQDESGVSQRPSICRTWAPKGKTPVLMHAFNWSKLSVCAAIGYRYDGPL